MDVPLLQAKQRAEAISRSEAYGRFREFIREQSPWRFQIPAEVLERDYLRIVDHHLEYLIPLIGRCVDPNARKVLDFGCGSGGSAIALALVYPGLRCWGADIDEREIAIARARANLYGVAERCEFYHVEPGERLPFADGAFDFCQCSSVLEYAIAPGVRAFCVREMVRLIRNGGRLFCSVPNRLYPFEIHTRKWGWNYFPRTLSARIVDSSAWEVRALARPAVLRLDRTPLRQLFTPWSNFCFLKESGAVAP